MEKGEESHKVPGQGSTLKKGNDKNNNKDFMYN